MCDYLAGKSFPVFSPRFLRFFAKNDGNLWASGQTEGKYIRLPDFQIRNFTAYIKYNELCIKLY